VQLYADRGPRRVRQVAGDLAVVLVGSFVVTIGLAIHDAIDALQGVGVQLDRSGRTVTQGADRAVEVVEGFPGLGTTLAAPFGTIGGAGLQLSAAGTQVTETVATVAVLVPTLFVGLVLGYVAFRYVPARVRWIREAAEVARLLVAPDAERLLAHRAVATRPLSTLRRLGGEDVAAALAAGRWAELAVIELDALGLDVERLSVSVSAPESR
jgi:hypothetical protein